MKPTPKKGVPMAEKTSANLPVLASLTTLAFTSADAEGTMKKILAASPDGFTHLNLDKITFPTSDSITLNVPTEEGLDPRRFVDVILVHHHAARQRYEGPYDVAANPAPPICSSYDGIRGHGNPGGWCASCKYNEVGPTAQCRPFRWLYLLFEESILPTFFPIPRTSLSKKLPNGIVKYVQGLAKGGRNKVKGGLWPWNVTTRIGLADRQRGVGKVATFTEGERLSETLNECVTKYAEDFQHSLTFPTADVGVYDGLDKDEGSDEGDGPDNI